MPEEGDQSDFMERPISESYGTAKLKDFIPLTAALEFVRPKNRKELDFMENLCNEKNYDSENDLENDSENDCETQNFGFIAYRKKIEVSNFDEKSSKILTLKIDGIVADRMLVIVDGVTVDSLNFITVHHFFF